MKYLKDKKGFTLIELLVVIAIIAILASVVIASLSSARLKSRDAAIKEAMNGSRAEAELYYHAVGNFTGVCTSTIQTNSILRFATAAVNISAKPSGHDTPATTCFESADGLSWAAAVQLNSPSTPTWYCVDSTEVAQEMTGAYPISAVKTTCN